MATDTAPTPATPASPPQSPPGPDVPSPRRLSVHGALLSYLVPGLGQIVQGRLGKGVLFLLCIYTLFFYGVYLGAAEAKVYGRTFRVSSNVYLPRNPESTGGGPRDVSSVVSAVANYPRPQFVGQVWVGIAAWPAIIQSYHAKGQADPNELDAAITRKYVEAQSEGNKEEADKLLAEAHQLEREQRSLHHPILGDFMREPTLQATNAVFNAGDKRLELAWVFTVIAGVLNLMVIWDALAGPAFTSPEDAMRKAG